MFDSDLAGLYGVDTKVLNQAVKRNKKRFPADFMFQLNKTEFKIWESRFALLISGVSRSQIVTLKQGRNIKYAPYVFTEQGVAMLSSVLNSDRAIAVNIQIMRTFTKIREMLASNNELRQKIEAMERKYDKKFRAIFQAIKQLIMVKKPRVTEFQPMAKIGFRVD